MLTSEYGPFQLNFWQAAQLRHFSYSLNTSESFKRNLLPFEEYCIERGSLSHTLSKIYALLVVPQEDFQLPFFQKWELDLDRIFSEEQRNNTVHLIFESLVCTKIQETKFKIFSLMVPNPSPSS